MHQYLVAITLTAVFLTVGHAADQEVNILFVNSLQYNIFPVTAKNKLCVSETDCIGGLGRLLDLRNSLISETNLGLFLNAGGALDGKWFNILKCQTISKAMLLSNFDAVALDAEIFQYGIPLASSCLETLNETLVSANSGVYRKYTTVEYGKEFMVGIIGFTDEEKLKELGISNTKDAVEAVKTDLAALKKEGKTKFHIAIGSTTLEKAREIAKIDGINLVLCSNLTGTSSGTDQFIIDKAEDNSYIIASLNITNNEEVPDFLAGYITMKFDTDKSTITDFQHEMIDYKDFNSTDGELVELLKTKMSELETPISSLSVNIISDGCIRQECLLGNLFADAIIHGKQDAVTSWEQLIKIAIVPGSSLSKISFTAGSVLVESVYEFFNPDITIYSVSLNGKQLKQLFDIAISDCSETSDAENFLQISGLISVEFDFDEKKVTQIKTVGESFVNTKKLQAVDLNDEKTQYLVAFPASLLKISAYQDLKNLSQELDITIGDAIEEYFRGLKYLTLFPVGQRITEFTATPTPDTKTCPNNTAEAVLLTLFILSLMAGLGYVTWRFVIPRVRARRNSTLPLVGST